MYCSWFLRSIFSAYNILSFMLLPSSLTLDNSFLRSSIFYWYCSSLLSAFKCFDCSFLILSKLYFSSSNCFNYCFRERNCSYLLIKFRLLYTFSNCLLTLYILFFISIISSCCFLSYPFFYLNVWSSSLGFIGPNFRFRFRSLSKIY